MKKITTFLFAACTCFHTSAQVGINTKTPQGTLDVLGASLIESYVIDTVNSYASGNYYLLTRSKDTMPIGKVKLLDIALRNVAPVNTYNIILKNVSQDDVVNLNTGLETSKYIVAITGAVFTDATPGINTTTSIKSFGAYSTEVTSITNAGKTYNAITLSFQGAGTTSAQNGTWSLTLCVYEKALVKDWGTYTGNINNTFTGVSTNTPIGLQ
ncbi:hypothetical protein SAMN05444360_108182 [Chryseobacterium carnipullorum]|uniref:hypothetical protein n=1 Tax=Chryseobacterium carnipullorum TaxID=1124835 RepID=UPI00091C56FF|nr:hypothetical protein [Chryseobacterium carnipullorum]SHM16270.1 hypothetical protein SAMN05444360_108182 [Chryseobacterium carnipullorum]